MIISDVWKYFTVKNVWSVEAHYFVYGVYEQYLKYATTTCKERLKPLSINIPATRTTSCGVAIPTVKVERTKLQRVHEAVLEAMRPFQ